MRVYHFLSAAHALDNIRRKRIKLSEIDKLNDPFELWCSSQENPKTRNVLRSFKEDMARGYGLLCFCKNWKNPVLWSHYADRHEGVCLGFDVPEESLGEVRYVKTRSPLPLVPTDEQMRELIHTKFCDWQYEKEWRAWFKLGKRENRSCFYHFDERIQLREVIAGPLCKVPFALLAREMANYTEHVSIIKARLAFRSFRIVKNRKGFRQSR